MTKYMKDPTLMLPLISRGTEEYCGAPGAADIICSTLGKAVSGAAGGYTTGPKELITLLRNVSRPYLFSNAPPPPVVCASLKVSLRDTLFENSLFSSFEPRYSLGEKQISFNFRGDW